MTKNVTNVTSHALGTLPLSQTVTLSRTPSLLERDVLYERPLIIISKCIIEHLPIGYILLLKAAVAVSTETVHLVKRFLDLKSLELINF